MPAAPEGRLLVFQGNGPLGAEPFVSDGTAAGTVPIGDIRAGVASSLPEFGAIAGTDLLFVADDGVHGHELWRVPVAGYFGVLSAVYGYPCWHAGGSETRIASQGLPYVPAPGFGFVLTGAAPNEFAALLIGWAPTDLPLSASCRLWVDNPVTVVAFTDGNGRAVVSLGIPANPRLLGAAVAGQFLAIDPPAGPGKFALSAGLRVLLGR